VIDTLARRYTVIAPDLLGHGLSDKPRADYSVGGYANGMRDLLTVLGIDRVTVVGHSFGGGVAMQFAYQFPERTERLVVVASGGLGPEVSPAIRAVTTPGFNQVMGVLTLPGSRHLGKAGLVALSAHRIKAARDLDEVAEIYDSFRDPAARAAIRHVVSAVVGLARPDRDDGRPRLPHRGDADGGDLGPRRPGDPGPPRQQRRRARARRPGRGDPARRPLPAQGPPAALRQGAARVHPLHRAGDVLPGPLPRPAQTARPPGVAQRPTRLVTSVRARSPVTGCRVLPGSVKPPNIRERRAGSGVAALLLDAATAVGSSMRYSRTPSPTWPRSISPASARAWSAWTTTDCASMWKNRRAAGRVSAKPKPSAPRTR
jgi:pimeloyl-ACP methyl ester carboxylesterase